MTDLKISIELLKNDLLFIYIIIHSIKEINNSVIALIFSQYISLFCYESSNFLFDNNSDDNSSIFINELNSVTKFSRNKIKFYNSRHFIDEFRSVLQEHKNYFNTFNTFPFRDLESQISFDLGNFYLNNDIILSNHSFFLDERLACFDSNTGDYARNKGYIMAKHVQRLFEVRSLRKKGVKEVSFDCSELNNIISNDFISQKFYSKLDISNDSNLNYELNGIIVYLEQKINQAKLILDIFYIRETKHSIFKYRYIILFHFYKSLKTIKDSFYHGINNNFMENFLKQVLDSEFSSRFINRSFRNILVHYGIPNNTIGLNVNKQYFGLTEHFFNVSFFEMERVVGDELNRISTIFSQYK